MKISSTEKKLFNKKKQQEVEKSKLLAADLLKMNETRVPMVL